LSRYLFIPSTLKKILQRLDKKAFQKTHLITERNNIQNEIKIQIRLGKHFSIFASYMSMAKNLGGPWRGQIFFENFSADL
jgi:hypothetical protein